MLHLKDQSPDLITGPRALTAFEAHGAKLIRELQTSFGKSKPLRESCLLASLRDLSKCGSDADEIHISQWISSFRPTIGSICLWQLISPDCSSSQAWPSSRHGTCEL